MRRPPISAVVVLSIAAPAMAQDNQPVAGPTQRAATVAGQGINIELTGRGSYTFDSGIDDTDGSVSIWRAGFGLGVSFQPFERARLTLGVDEEASWYLFDNATRLIPSLPAEGDPFELGLITTFSPRLSVAHDEHWSWFVGGIVQFAGDPDADVSDSGTYGGLAGARYAFSETFALTFGVVGKSRLEDDFLAFPLLGIDWKINDRVSFSTEGTVGTLRAKLDDAWAASLSIGWELREYRMADDAPVPDGVLGDSRVPIAVSFEWAPSPTLSLAITGGAVVWQEFEFRDSDGEDVTETNTDPAAFISLTGRIRF
jgi:hypothetical protein